MLPLISQPPPEPVLVHIEQVQTDIEVHKAEEARIAQEAIEASQKARIEALWAAHPAGNDYNYHQCVWWVAKWTRVPAGMHSAKYWWSTAKEWGFDVGLTPKAGAVGVSTRGRWGHVVLVQSVSEGGVEITIREGNYNWKGSVRTRKALASEFRYVYFE